MKQNSQTPANFPFLAAPLPRPPPTPEPKSSEIKTHFFNSQQKTLHIKESENLDNLEIAWKTNNLLDSFLVELLSSILVCLSVVFSWDWTGDNFALQFIPGIILGLIMLCIKDEDYFFPDGSPMVTVMIWLMGGYFSWVQSLVRISAHCIGFAVSLWICTSSPIPVMTYHRQYSPAVYFGMEALTTAIEHIAIVYVVMPLLPTTNNKGIRFLFPPVHPKSHPETMAPSNTLIMNSAIIFSLIHWVFWRMLNCEMNPSVLLLLTYLRTFQESRGIAITNHNPKMYYLNPAPTPSPVSSYYPSSQSPAPVVDHWTYGLMGIWGQFLGLLVSLFYAYLFIPRSYKFRYLSPYNNHDLSTMPSSSLPRKYSNIKSTAR
jgi:hypothetical protein